MAKRGEKSTLLIAALILGVVTVVVLYQNGQLKWGNGERMTQDASTLASIRTLATQGPEEWKFFKNANKDIQTLLKNQTIAFFVVDDPQNVDVAYFATYGYADPTVNIETLGVYAYTKPTYEFERIYKKTYEPGSVAWMQNAEAMPVWRLVGYDNGKLIVLMEDADNSPGPCAEPLLVGIDNGGVARLFTLDLANASAGLGVYTPNPTLVAEATEKQDACLAEME